MKALTVVAAIALAGCGGGGAGTQFEVNTDNKLVKDALPKIRAACPGLDVYSSQFINIRVEEYREPTIAFDVPDSAKLPPLFQAEGNSCFIEVRLNGKTAVIEKPACQSICLNRSQLPAGQLRLPLSEAAQ